MRLDVYVNYPGNCEEAFRYYEQHLGAKITSLTRHGDMPGPPNPSIPADWRGKVLHAHLELGQAALLGADIPSAETMRSVYVTLTIDDVADTERIYQALADGGQIFMKMEQTFFAKRFAMLRDRFGTSWMLIHGN